VAKRSAAPISARRAVMGGRPRAGDLVLMPFLHG
jgi:hypothetical protein